MSGYVTLRQIAAAAGRHYITVYRNAKAAGLLNDKPAGVQAHRIPVAQANRFMARQWPGTSIKEDVR